MITKFITGFAVTGGLALAVAGIWDVCDRWRNRRWEKRRTR